MKLGLWKRCWEHLLNEVNNFCLFTIVPLNIINELFILIFFYCSCDVVFLVSKFRSCFHISRYFFYTFSFFRLPYPHHYFVFIRKLFSNVHFLSALQLTENSMSISNKASSAPRLLYCSFLGSHAYALNRLTLNE